MLKSHSIVHAQNPDLSGELLYSAILRHSGLVDAAHVDEILRQADDSIDEWTTHSNKALGFREVVHFVLLSQYQAGNIGGAIVSFKNIVYSLVPADL